MMRGSFLVPVTVALVGAALSATAASAQLQMQVPPPQPTQEQRYGFNAIQREDLTAAEARLVAQRVAEPNEPAVLLNLAHVYTRTGRADQAEALYRQVLGAENALMATASSRPVWSHDLAQRGLDRTRSIAAR
jgi:Flp pilus assembly protein TadD